MCNQIDAAWEKNKCNSSFQNCNQEIWNTLRSVWAYFFSNLDSISGSYSIKSVLGVKCNKSSKFRFAEWEGNLHPTGSNNSRIRWSVLQYQFFNPYPVIPGIQWGVVIQADEVQWPHQNLRYLWCYLWESITNEGLHWKRVLAMKKRIKKPVFSSLFVILLAVL